MHTESLFVLFPLRQNERGCVCVQPNLQVALQPGECRHSRFWQRRLERDGGGFFLLKGDISGLIGRVNWLHADVTSETAAAWFHYKHGDWQSPFQMFFSFPSWCFQDSVTVGRPAAGHTGPSQRGRQLGIIKNHVALKRLEFAQEIWRHKIMFRVF